MQNKSRGEQIGLSSVDLIGKSLALLDPHALDTPHSVDKIAE